ncbi:MAG: hypothetical protein AABX29_06800 [Nanoarchaeota archaeon]
MVDEISLKLLNVKSLEILATLSNNPDGIEEKYLIGPEFGFGVAQAIKYLLKEELAESITIRPKTIVMKSIGQNDPSQGYKITKKGNELVKKTLEYVNDNLLVEGFRYL